MSFLEKEDGKQSSFWDWVVGIGLVVFIGGFTVFYQYQKRSSLGRFKQADALFQSGRLLEAGKVYEELKTAQYLTTRDDSTIYARLDTIQTAQELETSRVAACRTLIAAGDTAGAFREFAKIRSMGLLSPEDSAWVDGLRGPPDP